MNVSGEVWFGGKGMALKLIWRRKIVTRGREYVVEAQTHELMPWFLFCFPKDGFLCEILMGQVSEEWNQWIV